MSKTVCFESGCDKENNNVNGELWKGLQLTVLCYG